MSSQTKTQVTGTQGAAPDKLKVIWLKGPSWLSDEPNRPAQPAILETHEAKSKIGKKEGMLLMEHDTRNCEELLRRFSYWKLLHIKAHINLA